MKASLVVLWILKWTYIQTNEYNFGNTCQTHNGNLKWKLNVMELTCHELFSIQGDSQVKWSPFHTPFWMNILSNFGYPKHLWGPLHRRPYEPKLNWQNSHPFLIWSLYKEDTPHPMLECLIELAPWRKWLLPMWASMSVLFIVHHFTNDPTRMWHGSLFKQLLHTQRRGFPFPTHTHKTKTKRTIQIENPKKNIQKAKRREKKTSKKK